MTTETQFSYNSESSEFLTSQPLIYELLGRVANAVDSGRMKVSGRSIVKSDEMLGWIEELKLELPKVTSLSDQIVTKRDQMISDAEEFLRTSRADVMQETEALRQRAEEERNIILAQARNKAMEMINQSSVVHGSQEEAERIIAEAKSRAESIVGQAKREANQIRETADRATLQQSQQTDDYSRRMLMKLEEQLAHSLSQIRHGIDAVNSNMDERKQELQRIEAKNAVAKGDI